MIVDNVGRFYILNGSIYPAHTMENINIPTDNAVYEVIRIIDGVPLFIWDHYERMRNSFYLLKKELQFTEKDLNLEIRRLADENKQDNFNVKVMAYIDGENQGMLLYVSKSYYPVKEEIEKGVAVSLLYIERENPNAKVINQDYKTKVSRKIEEDDVFEVLLVNRANFITEGSRSNVFFVKNSKAYTAPGDFVLKGITRQYVMEACRRAGVELVEELIDVDSLVEVEALFLSGTSIKVLPISQVEQIKFASSVHPAVVAIRNEYDMLIHEYITQNK